MDNPLDLVKTKWLREFLTENLALVTELTPNVPNWQNNASIFATNLNEVLCDRGLTEPYQQKNPRSQVANVLRCYHPNHPAIPFPYVLLSSHTYTDLNLQQNQKTDQRQTKFFSGADAIALVDQAASLLNSDDPNDIAAGLAVLIGRRISEILISHFEPCTPYSVLFSEPVKKADALVPPFEIPTLIEADQVLNAITRLRDAWNIEDIKADASSQRALKQAINKRYEGVPKAVRRHFSDLIPGREAENDSGEKLYTHVFRSVYAEIATYFYKPARVPDHRFKAEIQGHFTLTSHGKVRVYTSRPHYDDYLIGDRTPNQDGIKLSLPDVSILSVFVDEFDKPSFDKVIDKPTEKVNDKNLVNEIPMTDSINAQDLLNLLQQQHQSVVTAQVEKNLAIIEAKDLIIQEKERHIAFLENQLKSSGSVPSYPDLSDENEQLKAQVVVLEQKLTSTQAQLDVALSKLAELQTILTQFQNVFNSTDHQLSVKETQLDKPTTDDKAQDKQQNNPIDNQTKTLNRTSVDKTAIVDKAIDAIKTYNNDPTRSKQEKWYISNPVVAELIRSSGFKISAKFMQDYLRERSADLSQHHTHHGLSPQQNTKHDLPLSHFIRL